MQCLHMINNPKMYDFSIFKLHSDESLLLGCCIHILFRFHQLNHAHWYEVTELNQLRYWTKVTELNGNGVEFSYVLWPLHLQQRSMLNVSYLWAIGYL